MAPTTPYDPLKGLEGMWSGSLIQLANFFKDPAGSGQQTQTVLRRTAKRYQDALDDCEIQILQAKWYLEHHLDLNRARRAQQASESARAANKRKLDSMNDEHHDVTEKPEENPAKRMKAQDSNDHDSSITENSVAGVENTVAGASGDSKGLDVDDEKPSKSIEASKEAAQGNDIQKESGESSKRMTVAPKKPPDPDTANNINPISTDFTSQDEPKTSAPATSIDEIQGSTFNSMFDDANDVGDDSNADLGFDVNAGTDPFASTATEQKNGGQANNSGSLDSLLPGLESYANQTGDDMINFDSSNAGGAGMDGAAGDQSDMFDLPDLGDSGFNDLLNDDSLGGGIGGVGDDMLNDDSMMNFEELDESFFNI